MVEVQTELQVHIENLRARAAELQQSSQPPSSADFADVVEEVALALSFVYAELKSLRIK